MNIIYLGIDGFPEGFAQVQKQILICKSLIAAQAQVTVISTKGRSAKQLNKDLKVKGNFEGINYIYSSLYAYRPKSFFLRTFFKIIGRILELFFIVSIRKRSTKNIAIISTKNILILKYYYFILHLLGFKVVLSYEEFVSSLPSGNINNTKVSFDDIAYKYCDGIMPISSYLENFIKSKDSLKKTFKIPVLADFDLIDSIFTEGKECNKALFCGSSAYYENICFIIDSFEFVNNTAINLELIIHGSKEQNSKIDKYIESASSKKARIKIKSNLTYDDLIRSYKRAKILLIPLVKNDRDSARFPHKIAEYTASNIAILTTSVGEINQYFEDSKNAFIVDDYDPFLYGNKLNYILENFELANQVAKNAYNLGRSKFHYQSIGEPLFRFFNSL